MPEIREKSMTEAETPEVEGHRAAMRSDEGSGDDGDNLGAARDLGAAKDEGDGEGYFLC
jgi:hypothetical protein